MVRVGLVGLGKMGLSHLAMIKAHPCVAVEAVCDATGYVLDVLNKYIGVRTYNNYGSMLEEIRLDAVRSSRLHITMRIWSAPRWIRGLNVFCEKPLCLSARETVELASMAEQKA